jgi:hypothetical protein
MNTKHTPGPLRVMIESTCSAAWPVIVHDCVDPETGEVWPRQVGQAENSHLETKEARESDGDIGDYSEMPHRFALADDGEESLANAKLWAAAPELLEALQALQKAGGIWPDLLPMVENAIKKATS